MVSVRGEAVLEVEAEIARLVVNVNGRDRKRGPALEAVEARRAATLEVARSFGAAVEKIETTGIRVHPRFHEGRPSERVDGYVAQITHTLTIGDFAVLGDLAAQLADADVVELIGPMWGLRVDTPVRAAARRQAVDDAVARAVDYAGALGTTVAGLVELADPGLLGAEVTAEVSGRLRMSKASGAPSFGVEDGGFTLEPQRQVVRAAIEARFTIAPPDLAQVVAGRSPD
jgi:uncharacterized protein